MTQFKAFADDTTSTMIDDLTIENQGDRLSIYGSLNLQLDQASLQDALALQAILQDAITFLQQQDLPEKVANSPQGDEIANPFL
ncbi:MULTISPECIES: hypothetical protein [unclassified Acinetobacter]|uniref:hypothetical protein n=1 Tax=unclassified Acinetobacter TaxID=196816 RepID=UPI0035BB2AB3